MPTNLMLNVLDCVHVTCDDGVQESPRGNCVNHGTPAAAATTTTVAPPSAGSAATPGADSSSHADHHRHHKGAAVRSLHVTLSAGCLSAHSLGFADGGAAAIEANLQRQLSRPQESSPPVSPRLLGAEAAAGGDSSLASAASAAAVGSDFGAGGAGAHGASDALALALAKRLALIMGQSYACLAASFAASCRLRIASADAAWFASLPRAGYLLHLVRSAQGLQP